MNYELINGDLQYRNKNGKIIPEHELTYEARDIEAYQSMFGYDSSIYEHIRINGTVAGFNGHYFCKMVYLDVDRDGDLPGAWETTKKVVTLLYNKLQVSPKEIQVYFSGGKGFHIGIPAKLFGQFEPRQDLPEKIKVLVVKLVAELFDTTLENIDKALAGKKKKLFHDIDLGIYNPNRVWRMINSKHTMSGLYKIFIPASYINRITVQMILEKAKAPVPDFKPELPLRSLQENQQLKALWHDALRFDPQVYQRSLNTENIAKEAFFGPTSKGGRNSDLFRQACMIFDHSDFHLESVYQIISAINLSCEPPLPMDEVRDIVKKAYKKTERNRQEKEKEEKPRIQIKTYPDYVSEWYDYYTQDSQPMGCLFDCIDEDQENFYEGKLACFIGSGGTRKSYSAQNVISQNIFKFDMDVAYSSMEMGEVEITNRFLDIFMDPHIDKQNYKTPASKYLQQMIKENQVTDLREQIQKQFNSIKHKLFMNSSSGMETEDYYKWIKQIKAIYGPIRLLVIDGLASMGGGKNEGETEKYSRHTLELKELAKSERLFIILVCHTSREAQPYTRDSRPYVRGSEKILDNSDFTICFSNLIDVENSTLEDIQYLPGRGHYKYYNKRGTGITLRGIYNIDSHTKRITHTDLNPGSYPDYAQFSRKAGNKVTGDKLPF